MPFVRQQAASNYHKHNRKTKLSRYDITGPIPNRARNKERSVQQQKRQKRQCETWTPTRYQKNCRKHEQPKDNGTRNRPGVQPHCRIDAIAKGCKQVAKCNSRRSPCICHKVIRSTHKKVFRQIVGAYYIWGPKTKRLQLPRFKVYRRVTREHRGPMSPKPILKMLRIKVFIPFKRIDKTGAIHLFVTIERKQLVHIRTVGLGHITVKRSNAGHLGKRNTHRLNSFRWNNADCRVHGPRNNQAYNKRQTERCGQTRGRLQRGNAAEPA